MLARDQARLDALAAEARPAEVIVLAADLGRTATSRAAGEDLVRRIHPGATLIHNAGLWPGKP